MVLKARETDLLILRYVNLNIQNYAQTLVEYYLLILKKEFHSEVVPFLKYYHKYYHNLYTAHIIITAGINNFSSQSYDFLVNFSS